MNTILTGVPNQLTALRLALGAGLWYPALTGRPRVVALGLLAAGLTDALDGFAARRLDQRSAFGSAFDSIADGVLIRCALVWLALLKPVVLHDHLVVMASWLLLDSAAFTLGLLKFRRAGNLHLSSSKAAAVAGYAFVVQALMGPGYDRWLFAGAVGLGIIAAVEALTVLLTQSSVDEHAGSIMCIMRRQRVGAESASASR